MCPHPPLRVLFVAALLFAALCGALTAAPVFAAPPPVFLPLVQPNQPPISEPGPPVSVQVTASAATVTAGQPVTLSAMLLDASGNVVPPGAGLDVHLSVGGRDLMADRIGTTAGPISYGAPWTPPAAGVYTVGAVAARAADGAKTGLPVTPFTVTVLPGPVATLHLAAHDFAALALPDFLAVTLYDAAGNALPHQHPAEVACASDSPAITAGAVQPLADNFYSNQYGVHLDASRQLGVPLAASAYGAAAVTCTHTPSGAMDTVAVAATPWELRLGAVTGAPGTAFSRPELFAMQLAARVPPGVTWTKVTAWLDYLQTPAIEFSGCSSLNPPDPFACGVFDSGNPIDQLYLQLPSASAHSGVTPAVRTDWQAGYISPTSPVAHPFTVTEFELSSPSGAIHYDPAPFDPWRTITVTIVPTVDLPVHVYIVGGSAVASDVEENLEAARRAFNLNRAVCGMSFDLRWKVTEIAQDAWAALDADGDGFDRWDSDGDGEFESAADRDDFAAAAAQGYVDAAPEAINVYYVPQVRGASALAGPVGAALAGQSNEWAALHLIAHVLDLRADGVADLAHGPGAPGNALNVDLPGPFLTPGQCAAFGLPAGAAGAPP